jgi:Tol biopolymer transport system component
VIVLVTSVTLLAVQSQPQDQFQLVSTIAFSSTRQCNRGQIFIMSPDGTSVQPLTDSAGCTHGDFLPNISPDGKKIVFDSTRLTMSTGISNLSDLFLMNSDGTEQTLLTRGTSATWSPDGKYIAFHASAAYHASGGLITLPPRDLRSDPGAPTIDSDLFVANVDDLIAGRAVPQNITNTPEAVEEDVDWSPDGTKIVFTRDPVSDSVNAPNYKNKQIYVMNADGEVTQLTFNEDIEERGPSWSPDGKRIMFIARVGKRGSAPPPGYNFEICVMDADGTNFVQLTDNAVFDGTGKAAWSPDGKKIVFHRQNQLWTVDADTTCIAGGGCTCSAMLQGGSCETQLPAAPGLNLLATWGELRVRTPTP